MMFLAGARKNAGAASSTGSSSGGKKTEKDDPSALVKEWRRNLQKEVRTVDRDINSLQRQEDKSLKECKALAKAGRMNAVKVLAKEVANVRRTIEQMHATKARLNSVSYQLQTTLSLIKLQGCMAQSKEIMAEMNRLVSVKEISETMNSMAKEMMKSGLIEDIIGDALQSDEVDDAAEVEVNRIVEEITSGMFAGQTAVPSTKVSATEDPAKAAVPDSAPAAEADDARHDELLSRLQAL